MESQAFQTVCFGTSKYKCWLYPLIVHSFIHHLVSLKIIKQFKAEKATKMSSIS